MGKGKWITVLAVALALCFSGFVTAGDIKDIKSDLKDARKSYISVDKSARRVAAELDAVQAEITRNGKITNALNMKRRNAMMEQRKIQGSLATVSSRYTGLLNRAFQINSLDAIKYLWTAVINKGRLVAPELTATEEGIEALTDDPAIRFLATKLSGSAKVPAKILLCKAFADMAHAACEDSLITALKCNKWEVVSAAADALKVKKVKRSILPLIEAMKKAEKKNNTRLTSDLRVALRRVTGQSGFIYATDFEGWWNNYGRDEDLSDSPVTAGGVQGGIKTMLYGEIVSKRVIFIVDRSGSMMATGTVPGNTTGEDDDGPITAGPNTPKPKLPPDVDPRDGGVQPGFTGTRLEICKIEFKYILSELPEDTMLNVIFYSNGVEQCFKKISKATKKNKGIAWKFIKNLKPQGGTNTNSALMAAFKDSKVDTIYLLSDGAPTVGVTITDQICANVKVQNQKRNIKIHTVALLLGSYGAGRAAPQPGQPQPVGPNTDGMEAFMKKLAEQNGGTAKVIK